MPVNISTVLKSVSVTKRGLFISSQKLSTKSMEHSNRVVTEAEKVVGYPASFLSLRWLLNDEVANVAIHLKKLIGTNHPLLKTARDLIFNKDSLSWGLIVLLVSKAGGLSTNVSQVDCDIPAGILHSQRVLAEITEMVRTSNLIHKSVLNISRNDENEDDLHFGNKLSLLTGDYLLSNSCTELAGLKCHRVNELVSTALRDLAEADFIEPRDRQNRPLPAKPLPYINEVQVPNHFDQDVLIISEVLGNAKAEWTVRHLLGSASLLGKCCQLLPTIIYTKMRHPAKDQRIFQWGIGHLNWYGVCGARFPEICVLSDDKYILVASLMLADRAKEVEESGYIFGRNMALALQLKKEISSFLSDESSPLSLISAPLMFHIQDRPEFYENLLEIVDKDNVRYDEIREAVNKGVGIDKSLELQEEIVNNSLEALNKFEESNAKTALINIIEAI